MFVDALGALFNDAVHGRVDGGYLRFFGIDIDGEGGDVVVFAHFQVLGFPLFKRFLAIEVHVEAGGHVVVAPIDRGVFTGGAGKCATSRQNH